MNQDNFIEEIKDFQRQLNKEMDNGWNNPVEEELRLIERAYALVKKEEFKQKQPYVEAAKIDYDSKRKSDETIPPWEEMLRCRYDMVDKIVSSGVKVSRLSVLECAVLGQYVEENKALYFGDLRNTHEEFFRMADGEERKKK